MRCSLSVSLAVLLIAASACFHATIDTGLTPSTVVIEKGWAAGWLWGLVPPSTVESKSKCPSDVAKIETKLSFLNQVASALTLGIYSPMAIKVTCAQAGH
jgi:Bor protein